MRQAMRGRRDHFSPRGYLRGFIHPDRLTAQNPLWVFDVGRRSWVERSPGAFGWTRGLYDYPPESLPDGTAEDVFLRPENDFPIVRDRIRSDGYATWQDHEEALVRFAAMLSARSPVFLEEAATTVRESLAADPNGDVLARNYGITTMRAEVRERGRRWLSLRWALRFTVNPNSPVVGCDQSVGMDGVVDDVRLALDDPRTTLFFPISWDMCLFGSAAPIEPRCAEFVEADLQRLRSFVAKQARVFIVSPVRLDGLTA